MGRLFTLLSNMRDLWAECLNPIDRCSDPRRDQDVVFVFYLFTGLQYEGRKGPVFFMRTRILPQLHISPLAKASSGS